MRIGPYIAMFVVCFGGVMAALFVYNRFFDARPAARTISDVLRREPVRYDRTPGEITFAEASQRLMPAVVRVDRLQESIFAPSGEMVQTGEGSGVIISSDGYIVTNYHVIQGAQRVQIRTIEGKVYIAEVAGTDPISDLALLKVEAQGLPAAELGDSEDLLVGEWVIAIGNPLGYEGTLSVGVVSALNRDLPGQGGIVPLVGAIQTDAAINPGNSGGALANIHGQVVGINTIIATPSGGSIGIGFAIPSSRVRKVVDDILEHGRVRHAGFGIQRFAPPHVLNHPNFEPEFGADPPERGLVVWDIVEGSDVAQSGIERGSVIVEIDGQPMIRMSDYLTYLLKAEIGHEAAVRFWKDGSYRTATVRLEEVTFH